MTAAAGLTQGAVKASETRRGALLAYGAAGCAAAAFTAFAVWSSPVAAYAHSNGVLRATIVLALVGSALFTFWRRPSSRLGPQIGALGALYAAGTLNAFADPALYTIGRIALAGFVVAFSYVALGFPHGRVEDRDERLVFVGLATTTAVLWLVLLLFAVRLPRGYMLTDCAGSCPPNPFALDSAGTSHPLVEATRIATAATAGAVAVLLVRKLRRASTLPRRGYAFVLAAIAALVCTFVAYGIWQPYERGGVRVFQAAAALAALLVPLALVGGQMRAHVISAWSLRRLVTEAGSSTVTLARLQELLRGALGDPTLTVRLWDPETREVVGVPEGDVMASPAAGRVSHSLALQGSVLGVVEHDALVDDVSGLAQALATASLVCFTRRRLLEELRETRSAARAAVDERIRLERDLHDGAVQRALGLQLGLEHARAQAGEPGLSAELERLAGHAATLRSELRDLAHGLYPPTLLQRGVTDAVAEATASFGDRVRVHGEIGRLPPVVEHELYLCTLEAVQNAVRHGGAWATADVGLSRRDGVAEVVVADDGVGFEPAARAAGLGLASMRDRIAAIGGTLEVVSRPGAGTRVRATVALDDA